MISDLSIVLDCVIRPGARFLTVPKTFWAYFCNKSFPLAYLSHSKKPAFKNKRIVLEMAFRARNGFGTPPTSPPLTSPVHSHICKPIAQLLSVTLHAHNPWSFWPWFWTSRTRQIWTTGGKEKMLEKFKLIMFIRPWLLFGQSFFSVNYIKSLKASCSWLANWGERSFWLYQNERRKNIACRRS